MFKFLSRALASANKGEVSRALDAAYERATTGKPFDLANGRMIVFSDQHRGARDGADDFRSCERAYNAALAYYLRMGHTLVILGDAEELWEESPSVAVRAYDYTLRNEARFHQAERYIRMWGNHDDDWRYPETVRKHLEPIFGGPLDVFESLRISVVDGREAIGELFLTHGHQGTGNSDKNAAVSKAFVRFLWRPLQRLSGWSFNTPSTDFRLREEHGQAMYDWAATKARVALVAGHTHAPVFRSLSHSGQLKDEIARLEGQLKQNEKGDPEVVQQLSEMMARLEWLNIKQPGERELEPAEQKPCYFNSGCCCFPDGDITGIELAEGEIRLVRWPDESRQPRARIMARMKLREVFEQLG